MKSEMCIRDRCMMAVLGPSLRNVILVIGVTGWVPYARTIRANVLALRKREFVLSAEALGASPRRIMFKHIMPNVKMCIRDRSGTGSSIITSATII